MRADPLPAEPTPPSPSTEGGGDLEAVRELAQVRRALAHEIGKRIVGQAAVIEQLLISMFARGHCLFVGVPGLAKTLLIQTLADALSLRFNRIQFTPDLMPSDVTGTDVLDLDGATGRREFRFVPGPIFTNILLADEVNRTPPKTQAALLQSMQEGQVTAGGRTYPLPPPYLVFATQNPIEQEGTYPLPEAQLDRFMLQIDVGYPSEEEEREIVRRTTGARPGSVAKVLSPERILALQDLVLRVPAPDPVVAHAVRIVRATRPGDPAAPGFVGPLVAWGAGPRAAQHLIAAAKARAVLSGRFAASFEDVRALAGPVLRHRLVLSYRAESEGATPHSVLERILESTPA